MRYLNSKVASAVSFAKADRHHHRKRDARPIRRTQRHTERQAARRLISRELESLDDSTPLVESPLRERTSGLLVGVLLYEDTLHWSYHAAEWYRGMTGHHCPYPGVRVSWR